MRYKLSPACGFTLFYRNQLNTMEVQAIESKHRGNYIMNQWNNLLATERMEYIQRSRVENDVKKDLINQLNLDELEHTHTQVRPTKIGNIYREDHCCICLASKPTILFNPCGHISYCFECIDGRIPSICSICREQITSITNLGSP